MAARSRSLPFRLVRWIFAGPSGHAKGPGPFGIRASVTSMPWAALRAPFCRIHRALGPMPPAPCRQDNGVLAAGMRVASDRGPLQGGAPESSRAICGSAWVDSAANLHDGTKCKLSLLDDQPLLKRLRRECHRTVAFHGHASRMQSTLAPDSMPTRMPDLDEQLRHLEARLASVEAALLSAPCILQPPTAAELAAIEHAIAEHCH